MILFRVKNSDSKFSLFTKILTYFHFDFRKKFMKSFDKKNIDGKEYVNSVQETFHCK